MHHYLAHMLNPNLQKFSFDSLGQNAVGLDSGVYCLSSPSSWTVTLAGTEEQWLPWDVMITSVAVVSLKVVGSTGSTARQAAGARHSCKLS